MEGKGSRVGAVDLLRGLVMILMALDHTRDFLHVGAAHFQPEDLTQTTTAIFLTRWITHFCAPVFMFTAGLGAYFYGERRGGRDLTKFLVTRGLWLMLLEVTVLRFAFFFSLTEGPLLLTVLWALGLSMLVLAVLVQLPARATAAVGLGIILFHNMFDGIEAARFGAGAWVWNILHQQGAFSAGGLTIVVAYPLIPWAGVMAAGYCLGPVFLMDDGRRRRTLVRLGIGMTVAFLVLRAVNRYGDPVPWGEHRMLLSFLRCTKYPPSLDFLLMTLGPAIALAGWFGDYVARRSNPLRVFGRVPLFYFVVHLFAIHLAAVVLSFLRYGTLHYGLQAPPAMGTPLRMFPPDYGYDLWVVYVVWVLVVVAAYPLCLWFAGVKERRRDWWLGYL